MYSIAWDLNALSRVEKLALLLDSDCCLAIRCIYLGWFCSLSRCTLVSRKHSISHRYKKVECLFRACVCSQSNFVVVSLFSMFFAACLEEPFLLQQICRRETVEEESNLQFSILKEQFLLSSFLILNHVCMRSKCFKTFDATHLLSSFFSSDWCVLQSSSKGTLKIFDWEFSVCLTV